MMEAENLCCTCDDRKKLGAGDNDKDSIFDYECNVDEADELNLSENLNDSVLDDIEEEEESEENTTSQGDSTSEECESDEEDSEEIEYEAGQMDEENSLEDKNTVLSDSRTKTKPIQPDRNETNVATIEVIHRKTVPERPKEYISLLGPDSFMKTEHDLKRFVPAL